MTRPKEQFHLEGIEKVMRNMNKELQKIEGRSKKGLIHANIVLHRAMETESPTIPVDTGNLRHSYFATIKGTGTQMGKSPSFKGEKAAKMRSEHSEFVAKMTSKVNTETQGPSMIFGFSANYAAPVHENTEATFRRSNAGAKYMETHLNRKQGEMLEEIRKEAHIG